MAYRVVLGFTSILVMKDWRWLPNDAAPDRKASKRLTSAGPPGVCSAYMTSSVALWSHNWVVSKVERYGMATIVLSGAVAELNVTVVFLYSTMIYTAGNFSILAVPKLKLRDELFRRPSSYRIQWYTA
ncbi:uncharacterized protein BCR38DRAFT_411411 [Pseudomassariella vexata]|uniref:Uncharacterized protein n=1 Tax=Pseudomassariella vexata TaxID=1141098 RepID=A0A1Y2DQQ2_9PEZI|nr:uncharacterized protein BCR38DRAFT_411411 [Pseudomassariella vexata]ORY61547.1 hypothetical protein BCR38DRAFT_411411 [Pseudomassariella vexata]